VESKRDRIRQPREEYDRTPRTPLDHRGTSDCPVLDAIGERAVYPAADSVDRSERLVSRSDLVHMRGPSVVYYSEKGTLGSGLRGSTAAATGQHCDLGLPLYAREHKRE
jgi:hypothetical protein